MRKTGYGNRQNKKNRVQSNANVVCSFTEATNSVAPLKPHSDQQIPHGGYIALESLTPEQRRTWRYWGTREYRDQLAEQHPEQSQEMLDSLYAMTQRIYRTEMEKLKVGEAKEGKSAN